MSLLFSFLFFFLFGKLKADANGLVGPALYVFGDSVMDPGNNIFLNTSIKVNFSPFGIDFPSGPTGRFTNGHTIADFLYKWAKEKSQNPIPLPYMNPLKQQDSNTKGFNYASGTAGILPDTNRAFGENLWLGKQVALFRETVEQNLSSLVSKNNERIEFSSNLSESIFVVCIGSNDYMNHHQPGSNLRNSYNAEQFGEFLAKQLGNHIQDLYNLGARKFVIFEIGPLGCLPEILHRTKPSTLCNEQLNGLVSIFNNKLGIEVNHLSSKLQGSTFVTAKAYQLIYDIIHNPLQHGFEEARLPCCASGENGTGNCLPQTAPCQNRSSHVFWDSVHPTEAMNWKIAEECLNGKRLCTPMNLAQLAAKQ